jgi:DNA-binding transcriptional regulator YdaS (Cro superfamily)
MNQLALYLRAERGRASRLATGLKVTPVFIGQIAKGDRPAPAERCTDIERLTEKAVRRWHLRPHDWHRIWPALSRHHTLIAVGIFVVGTFAVGHLLGGPDRRDAAVLAFASSCRHPATALALASANFPDIDEHAAVALYGLVTVAVGAVYTLWLRRHRAVAG